MLHLYAFPLLMLILMQATMLSHGYEYNVGDLDSWGIPTSANPDVYTKWSNNHVFRVGDSLLFLYPPSQDSMIQVTPQAYKRCNLKDPILYMNDGNSLFNITQPGELYFTSGEAGHCNKGQKLHISLSGDGAIAYPPSTDDTAPGPSSYANVFGSIPTTASSSSHLLTFPSFFIGFTICLLAYSFA